MNEYEITFKSWNLSNPKRTTALVVAPDQVDTQTGFIHFAHGWGGNRFAFPEMYRDFAERYNIVAIATEYRGSGYDVDPIVGRGALLPYDAGHLQVFDCLCALRVVLSLYRDADKRRVIAWGGSMGGQIAMLMSIFCPNTFALVVSTCGVAYTDEPRSRAIGRDLSEDELAIRDTIRMAHLVKCPVALAHGTADTTVPDTHTRSLESALRAAGKTVKANYIEGAGHAFEPVSERATVTRELADDWLLTCRSSGRLDFDTGSKICIPCVRKTLVIDWSKTPEDPGMIKWEDMVLGSSNY
jgi:dienelactone hydrolase